MTKHKALSTFLIALVVTLAAAGALSAQSNRSVFGWVVTNRATVQDGGLIVTGDTVLADTDMVGAVSVSGDLIVTDDASANDLTVADFVNVTAQSVITLTSSSTLTATGSLQPIASAGAVGIDGGTKIVHVTDYLILVNTGAQTITFTETTGLISAGNLALGAGDSATLVWANGGWMQVAASNN